MNQKNRCPAAAGDEEKLAVVEVDLNELNHPAFGALICRDFTAEHHKYDVRLKS